MATLHSTGLHEPTGLQYLIEEGFLSKDADPSSYKWLHQPFLDLQILLQALDKRRRRSNLKSNALRGVLKVLHGDHRFGDGDASAISTATTGQMI